jgi:hypothetical protein
MKKNIIIILSFATIGLFSCKQDSKLTPESVNIENSNSVKNIQNDKNIYTKYEYADSKGGNLIIQNSFPKGGTKYTAPDGEVYYYAVFFTRIINETDNPLELKINFRADSYELPSLPEKYFKILLPPNKMTLDKEPLFNYGLTELESFLDNNRNKSSSLNSTIDPKDSTYFYVLRLNISPKSGLQSNGSIRAEFSLRNQNLYYKVKNDGSKTNSESSDIEINCGSINFKNVTLQK